MMLAKAGRCPTDSGAKSEGSRCIQTHMIVYSVNSEEGQRSGLVPLYFVFASHSQPYLRAPVGEILRRLIQLGVGE